MDINDWFVFFLVDLKASTIQISPEKGRKQWALQQYSNITALIQMHKINLIYK